MHLFSITLFLVLLPGFSAPVLGQSTTQLDNGDYHTVIDATAGGSFATEAHDFTYFSFEQREVVSLTDAEATHSREWQIAFKRSEIRLSGGQEAYFNLSSGELMSPADPATSMDWDLHFSGYVIRLNGGISGPGQGGAFPAYQTGQSFEDITRAMGFGYFADKAGSAFSSDSGEWYSYDSETHLLSTRNHVYLIDTGEGFYKMQILNFYLEVEGSPVSGFVTFRWRPLGAPAATAVQSSSWGRLKERVMRSN